MKTYIVIIFLEYIFSLIFTREFIVMCARVGGANTTPLFFSDFSAAYFAKRNLNGSGFQSEGAAEGGCGGNSAASERPAGAKRRRASFSQNGFAQSLEYPTIRYFQNFLSQTEALPRGFAARHGRVPQGGTLQNPTARQTKQKPLFASKTI